MRRKNLGQFSNAFFFNCRPISKKMRLQTNKDSLLNCNGPSTIRRSSYNEMVGQAPVVIITPDTQNEDHKNGNNLLV